MLQAIITRKEMQELEQQGIAHLQDFGVIKDYIALINRYAYVLDRRREQYELLDSNRH